MRADYEHEHRHGHKHDHGWEHAGEHAEYGVHGGYSRHGGYGPYSGAGVEGMHAGWGMHGDQHTHQGCHCGADPRRHGGRDFRRKYWSRGEVLDELHSYLADLRAEISAVEEHITHIERHGG